MSIFIKRKPVFFIALFNLVAFLCMIAQGGGVAQGQQAATSEAQSLQESFIEVAKKVGPAVVLLTTERTEKMVLFRGRSRLYYERFRMKGLFDKDPFEEFFKDFFGGLPQAEFKRQGLGSGVVIDKRGHILTNQHVIEGADKITVILPDGRAFDGEVKGEDVRSDLAVVQIYANDLPAAELGDSDSLLTGQWAIALGNPFGHVVRSPKPTLTVGVISALHRSIPFPGRGERRYIDLIQTDAAINIGNSGGPLCNLDGKVIGINVAIFSGHGGNIGIGFAIPINLAKSILNDLIEGKKVVYGWIGVSVQNLSQDLAEYFGLPTPEGSLVIDVFENSPAQRCGLREGDIIKGYDGKPVREARDLVAMVSMTRIGQKAELAIIRDGKELTLGLEISPKPSEEVKVEEETPKAILEEKAETWRGIEVAPITDEFASKFGLKKTKGVLIAKVIPDSPAYNAGLRPGEIIEQANRRPVETLSDYAEAIKKTKGSILIKTDKGYYIIKESE